MSGLPRSTAAATGSRTQDPVTRSREVGTTKIAAGFVDIPRNGRPTVGHYERINHDDIGREAQLLEKIVDVVRSVMNAAGVGKRDLHYIGVGLPGQISYDAGLLTFAPGLKLRDIPVAGELRRTLDIPIFIDNDINCSTLAELHFGDAGKLYNHFVCILIGTGFGAGIVIDKYIEILSVLQISSIVLFLSLYKASAICAFFGVSAFGRPPLRPLARAAVKPA